MHALNSAGHLRPMVPLHRSVFWPAMGRFRTTFNRSPRVVGA